MKPMFSAAIVLATFWQSPLAQGHQTSPKAAKPPTAVGEAYSATVGQRPSQVASSIPVIVNDDGFSNFTDGHYRDRESLESALKAAYSGGNVSILEWTLGPCGTFTFGTKIGDVFGDGVTEFARHGDQIASQVVHQMIAKGDDPLKVVIEICHKIKVKAFISFRMNAVYLPPFEYFNGRWFDQHKNAKIVGKDGKFTLNYSYAYQEVRDFRLNIIKEALAFHPDGLNLDFNRNPPFFGYESGLIHEFKKRFGDIDPKTLSESDPRWFDLRASYMTSFVKGCRKALDATGPGKRLSVRIDADKWYVYACDVPRWIKEGLVDIVIPTKRGYGGFDIDLAPFLQMCRGTQCQIFFGEEAGLSGHDLTPEEDKARARGEKVSSGSSALNAAQFRERALRWKDNGADGVHLFNVPLKPAIYAAIHNATK